ncbi:sugar kinase [Devosia pacifica]|uniref:Sugar kinase n=1 Tax=Devosia pacifica TaxID=1335967 RepID=A0A918VUY7_9HYPH|nr:PfkB family carbohydrate kinase [Devosia pacifica]GHA25557.1 sugar kinase [Devosia pacifica]
MTLSALVVGDVMTDVIVRPHGPMVIGSDRAATIRSHPGGSGANQAEWLAALGVPTRFAARVGAGDQETLATSFRARGVEAVLAADPALPTGVLVTLLDESGERSFLTDRGANVSLSATDLPTDLLDDVGVVLVSGYSLFADGPRAAVLALLASARERGIETAIDAASTGFLAEVGPDRFLEWATGTSLLLANAAEAALLAGSDEPQSQCARLGERCETIILKQGAAGASVGTRQGISASAEGLPADVVDSTGAGDAFAAGFLAARLAALPLEEQLARGIAAGARAVARLGGRPDSTPN